jgi:hypothetical protein
VIGCVGDTNKPTVNVSPLRTQLTGHGAYVGTGGAVLSTLMSHVAARTSEVALAGSFPDRWIANRVPRSHAAAVVAHADAVPLL